jgi:hypothetical protein
MPRLINAHLIFDGLTSQVAYDYPLIQINCENLGAYAPRPVVVKRRVAPGFGVQDNNTLTFDLCDPEIDENSLFGYAVTQVNGDGTGRLVVVDATSAEAIVTACNACCDDAAETVTGIYTSGIPVMEDLSLTTYTLTRMDDGQPYDIQQATLDYLGQYFPGTFRHTGWQVSGVSTYTFQSFTVPVEIGSDVIT